MRMDRLRMALSGGLELPEDLAVLRPAADDDLSLLDGAMVVTGDAVAAARFKAQGREVCDTLPEVDAVLACLPRSKDYARALIHAAASKARQLVLVDGQKTDGAESILRDLRKRLPGIAVIAKAHGKLAWFSASSARDALAEWADPGLRPGPDGMLTQPGVFSEDKVDAGSRLLAEHLPKALPGHVVDLGAGWGWLSRDILSREGVTRLDAVEAELRAVEAARANLTDPRVSIHWADALSWTPDARPDHVVMNPPFHKGRAADPSLGAAFIAVAAKMLDPKGQLWMVANRQLPYEAALEAGFAHVVPVAQNAGFKVLHASRPRR
ncbi:MAG: MFS transporter [Rhodobacterales bacterium]|nr:MAG: MFS transporter [Rhodobacterales bacterium]